MNNNLSELNRIKAMMTYGLQTEGKKQYSSVEYSKEAADGKVYGIVREGTKYYIKVSKDKKNLVKENFDYIGGFVNRKDYEYSSYANALKHFDMKMMSLREAFANGKNIIIESWNPDKQEELALESTDKMRKEIMRQRQIMTNARLINEKKEQQCGKGGDPFCISAEEACKGEKDGYCVEEPDDNIGKAKEPVKGKEIKEAADKLAWHKTGGDAQETIADTYMDKSHGTKIGDGSPFNKARFTNNDEMENGVVEEHNTAMAYASDNQNSPEPGVGPIGDDQPFDGEKGTQIQEDINDLEDTASVEGDVYDSEYPTTEGDEEDPFGDEAPVDGGDDMPTDGDGDVDADTEYDLELDDELGAEGGDDIETRLSSIEDTLSAILDKIDNLDGGDFEDDTLYDDDTDGEEPVDSGDEELGGGDTFGDENIEDDDTQIYESRSYRRMRLAEENRLNDFGKHPAYRKVPMQLPPTGEDKNSHGRDWNDDSVHSEQPYGEKIGSGAPFDVDIQTIENSIAESIQRYLKKK